MKYIKWRQCNTSNERTSKSLNEGNAWSPGSGPLTTYLSLRAPLCRRSPTSRPIEPET